MPWSHPPTVGATGTIVITGTDIFGNAQIETITAPSVASQTLYSVKVYQTVGVTGGMMRKRYKNKKRCCKMCKDYKRGWAKRWDGRELERRQQFERCQAMREYENL